MKYLATVQNGELVIKNNLRQFLKDNEGAVFEIQKRVVTRSSAQNNSIHLWLTQVADELDKGGHTLQDVIKAIKKARIRPTMEALKEIMWKPIQWILYKKKSTTELHTTEVDRVYETASAFLGREFFIHIPFPSQDLLAEQDPNFIKN